MELTMLKGKIHRAVVKQAELNYVGSITIDPELMDAAPIEHKDSLSSSLHSIMIANMPTYTVLKAA